MRFIADLHVHSKYAQATSKHLDVQNLEKWATVKGVHLLGTGDFTHPKWIAELKEQLTDDGTGIFRTATGFPFVLQTELSLAYTQDGKGRRIHYVVLAPDFDTVHNITEWLLTKGRVDYDGRPIFGINSIEFVETLHSISQDIEVIPAHAWTSWFGIFGSNSGFDSLKDCFQEKTKLIHAIETGMSSDPSMNWRLKQLDNITLLSNSDLHSFWPWRIGREANVIEMGELSYRNVLAAIRQRKGLKETIEVNPNYGKYHYDGHRTCGVVLSPAEAIRRNNTCPVCRRPLTIGVEHRVEELADRAPGFIPEGALPFRTLLPLSELISTVQRSPLAGKKTWDTFNNLVDAFKNELAVLLDAPEADLRKLAGEKLAAVILQNRRAELNVKPGYDGAYGKLVLGDEPEQVQQTRPSQTSLGDFSP